MRSFLAAAFLVLLAFVALPHSEAADQACGAQVIALGGHAYIATDGGFTNDEWIYLESNNEPGLQRGGMSVLEPLIDPVEHDEDSCQASATPDTLLF